jgi:hypothetical protein
MMRGRTVSGAARQAAFRPWRDRIRFTPDRAPHALGNPVLFFASARAAPLSALCAGKGAAGMTEPHRRRLDRQLAALAGRSPGLQRFVKALQGRRAVFVRVPLGLVLIAGGFLAILPVFGLWMIPLGLLLLAMDLPVLRPFVSGLIIRLRRRWALWLRWWRSG